MYIWLDHTQKKLEFRQILVIYLIVSLRGLVISGIYKFLR